MCLSFTLLFSSHFYLYSDLNSFFHMDNAKAIIPCVSPTEESCSLAEFTPPTGYEPKLLDDFHYSETTEMIFQEESSDKETEPSYLCDAELDDETIGKALSSPLFIQERGESADRRQACHSFSHTQERGDPCTNLVRKVRAEKNEVAKWETKESGFSLKDKKSKFSLILEPRFRNTNCKPILIGDVPKN